MDHDEKRWQMQEEIRQNGGPYVFDEDAANNPLQCCLVDGKAVTIHEIMAYLPPPPPGVVYERDCRPYLRYIVKYTGEDGHLRERLIKSLSGQVIITTEAARGDEQ